jgi:hypothetical protein
MKMEVDRAKVLDKHRKLRTITKSNKIKEKLCEPD